MVRAGEIEHSERIAERAEAVWNWASPAGQVRAARRARLLIDAANLTPADRALELGCGTGLFSRHFARSGCRLVAIDVSVSLLNVARQQCPGQQVTFRLDDAERMSFDERSFDVVLGSSVLHHLNLERALPEIFRVLKPGGRIAFAEPNMMNPQIALQRTVPPLRRWAGESPEETAFVRWRLASRLRDSGFVGVRVEPFDFLHPAVPSPLIDVVEAAGRRVERCPGLREIAGSLLISAGRGT